MSAYFKFITFVFASLILAINATPKAHAQNDKCIGETPCMLGERSYHVLPPDNWDGVSELPVMLYFHGWGRQGPVPIKHKHIGDATRKHGVLLIAPNGLGKSWSFWQPQSRDTDFALKILDDVEKTYPIKRNKLLVSGYSWGSSMAWRFSCDVGEKVSVLLGISGTLYDQDEPCHNKPVEVRHVHGLKDTVMDYPYAPDGSEKGPVRLWNRINGCASDDHLISQWETSQKFKRYEWTSCAQSKSVTLDIHKGGHWIAKGWLDQQLQELKSRWSNT